MIRPAAAADAESIAGIYNHYVSNSIITFEELPVSSAEMAVRIAAVASTMLPWLICEHEGVVVGYSYASPWKTRGAYRFTVETAIYVAPSCGRRGFGTVLYRALLEQLRQRGMHVALGGIALPNPESVALHERVGFQRTAQLSEVGFKFGQWIDVGYWQLLL